ncbi:MAG: hypothetical protein ORN85_08425, partial [Sediminibacterium sp.]|nr:hypothetical protein [Sediminibacterium sp.]
YDSANSYTFNNINSYQNIEVFFIPQNNPKLASTNKSIFKLNDTLVIRGRNLYQIELKTIANQNIQYVSKLDSVTAVSGTNDSLYSFIIPDSLQNVVYKIRGINIMTNDTSSKSFVIRVSNNYDSLGVIGWGRNDYSQLNLLAGLSNVVQVATGADHTLALKSDGSVVGWGANNGGQITIPSDLKNVVQISAGDQFSVALKSDGTAQAWGSNDEERATIPIGLSNIVQLAAGNQFGLALKSDGSAIGWGDNSLGQITIPSGLNNIIQIGTGFNHSLALKSDSTVAAWGYNNYGERDIPANLRSVVQIAVGTDFNLALKSDGTVVGWGYNGQGQTSIPPTLTNAKQIAAGGYHCVALTNADTIVAWGRNTDGQTNIPAGLNNVVEIISGSNSDFSFAMYKKLNIISSAGIGGTISPAGQTLVNYGARPTYIISANTGYELDSLVINGVKVTNINSYTFESVKSNQTIRVTFKVRTFTVSSSAGNNGSISFAGIDTVNYGDTLTYKFVANTG